MFFLLIANNRSHFLNIRSFCENLIIVEHNPSKETLEELKVSTWEIWEKEVSEFELNFVDTNEMAYILEGEIIVTPKDGGDSVTIKAGDLVTFNIGLFSDWKVVSPLKKHYLEYI